MTLKAYYFTLIVIICTLTSCSDRSTDDLISSIQTPDDNFVTYNNTVASIINSTCIGCHAETPQNGAPMSLTTYSEVVDAIVNRGLNVRINSDMAPMPPTGLMSQANRTIVQEWIDNGFPENN